MAWEFSNSKEMLESLVGHYYGADPESQMDQILKDRLHIGQRIRHHLNLKPTDVGMDLGAGCGLIIPAVAPYVATYYACDISQSFQSMARENFQHHKNVQFEQIQNGHFGFLPENTLDFAFSHAVFIHFDLYDLVLNIKELARVLRPGAKIIFDFLQTDSKDYFASPVFQTHMRLHAQSEVYDRGRVQYHAKNTVFEILKHFGFHIIGYWEGPNCNVEVVAQKNDPRSPQKKMNMFFQRARLIKTRIINRLWQIKAFLCE